MGAIEKKDFVNRLCDVCGRNKVIELVKMAQQAQAPEPAPAPAPAPPSIPSFPSTLPAIPKFPDTLPNLSVAPLAVAGLSAAASSSSSAPPPAAAPAPAPAGGGGRQAQLPIEKLLELIQTDEQLRATLLPEKWQELDALRTSYRVRRLRSIAHSDCLLIRRARAAECAACDDDGGSRATGLHMAFRWPADGLLRPADGLRMASGWLPMACGLSRPPDRHGALAPEAGRARCEGLLVTFDRFRSLLIDSDRF